MTAFVVAALLAGGITLLFYRQMGHTSQVPPPSEIVVATRDLPIGATLTPDDVKLLKWYSPSLPAGAFIKTEGVLGRPLLFPVVAKQPIVDHNLGVSGAGIGLAGKIPPGMRAIAVRSNEISGVAGFLYPGSHVDCLVTFTPIGGKIPETQTVLQNVEVLAAGQTIEPDPQGKPQKVNVVTVLLTPEDSQKLQLASAQGNIQFVLRSGADHEQAAMRPTTLDQIFASERSPVVTKAVKHTPRQAKPVYVLEVIQGTKRSEEKFAE